MAQLNYKDLDYLSYAEWISGDYNEFVKKTILPSFSKRYALKMREVRVLIAISEFNALKTSGEIAEHLRQDPATITRSMVTLIGKGFVSSRENFHDGRSRILTLNEKGETAANYFFKLFETAVFAMPDNSELSRRETETLNALQTLSQRARLLHDAQKHISKLLQTRLSQTS